MSFTDLLRLVGEKEMVGSSLETCRRSRSERAKECSPDLLFHALKLAAEKRIRSGVATDSDRLEFEMRSVDLALGIGASLDAIIEPQATVDHQHEWKSELVHSESEHEF